jgi:hypothetical protein
MINAQLLAHPTTPAKAARAINASVTAEHQNVVLTFTVTGEIQQLLIPALENPKRTNELWQHTCFELFAKSPGAFAYVEFNFSPSGEWAAYRFSDYRAGMEPLELRADPHVRIERSDRELTLEARLHRLDLPSAAAELALTAVIEERSGKKSYWAVKHAPSKPDFHQAQGFALTLQPADGLSS